MTAKTKHSQICDRLFEFHNEVNKRVGAVALCDQRHTAVYATVALADLRALAKKLYDEITAAECVSMREIPAGELRR